MGYERFVDMTNCLVVDPSEDSCNSVCDLLSNYDFTLETETDGHTALERCERDMPDVVMFSSAISDMDVSAFLKALNKRGQRTPPVAVMYCETADAGEIGRAVWDGAQGCMVKPFDARVLDDTLRQSGVI